MIYLIGLSVWVFGAWFVIWFVRDEERIIDGPKFPRRKLYFIAATWPLHVAYWAYVILHELTFHLVTRLRPSQRQN